MRKCIWLISTLGIAGLWSGGAIADGGAGCPPFGYCAAPSSTYTNYSARQTGYVVGYRTVRVARPAVYGYRAGPVVVTQRRPYRVYYNRIVNYSDYSSPYAGPSVPMRRE